MRRTESKKRIVRTFLQSKKLGEIEELLDNCYKCPAFSEQVRGSGFGNPMASTLIIGQSLHGPCSEVPGKQIPFIGPMEVDSGDVLFAAIEKAGLVPESFWITNLVKCHPPGNRQSTGEEIITCWPYLLDEFDIIRPVCVITLGRQATDRIIAMSNAKKVVNQKYLKGRASEKKILRIFPLKHPSWAMRMGAKQTRIWITESALVFQKAAQKGKRCRELDMKN